VNSDALIRKDGRRGIMVVVLRMEEMEAMEESGEVVVDADIGI